MEPKTHFVTNTSCLPGDIYIRKKHNEVDGLRAVNQRESTFCSVIVIVMAAARLTQSQRILVKAKASILYVNIIEV